MLRSVALKFQPASAGSHFSTLRRYSMRLGVSVLQSFYAHILSTLPPCTIT